MGTARVAPTTDAAGLTVRLAALGFAAEAAAMAAAVAGGLGRLGGITNTSHRVMTHQGEVVIRLPGAGTAGLIDRGADGENSAIMSQRGIDVPLVAFDAQSGLKLTRYLATARPLTANELRDPACLVEICALLRRVHKSGGPFRSAFCPLALGEQATALLSSLDLPLPTELGLATAALAQCRERLARGAPPPVPCHQDLYRENFLRTGGGLLLIDWEHSGLGDPLYDLADLAVQAGLDHNEARALLDGYHQTPSISAEVEARFALQRQVSRLTWGVWAVTRASLGYAWPEHRAAGVAKIVAARAELGLG